MCKYLENINKYKEKLITCNPTSEGRLVLATKIGDSHSYIYEYIYMYIGIPQFISVCFIIYLFILFDFFKQIEGLWQSCVEQVYWCHFCNSIIF